MPVRQLRTSRIGRVVREAILSEARSMVEGIGCVTIHAILDSGGAGMFAPTETNALRIVVDGWAASLHRTAVPVLVHVDDGADVTQAVRGMRKEFTSTVRSQLTRWVTAHRAGLAEPHPFDPYGPRAETACVDHLEGHFLEMLRLHHEGGADRIRSFYGDVAAAILARRVHGIGTRFDRGSLANLEISADVPIGEHAVVRRKHLLIDGHLPEIVMAAMKDRPLGDHLVAGGIDHLKVWNVETCPGNPLAHGIALKDHTRIHLMGDMKCGVASFINSPHLRGTNA